MAQNLINHQLVEAHIFIIREIVFPIARATYGKIVYQYTTFIKPLTILMTKGVIGTTSACCIMAKLQIEDMEPFDIMAATVVPCLTFILVFSVAATFMGRRTTIMATLISFALVAVAIVSAPGCVN